MSQTVPSDSESHDYNFMDTPSGNFGVNSDINFNDPLSYVDSSSIDADGFLDMLHETDASGPDFPSFLNSQAPGDSLAAPPVTFRYDLSPEPRMESDFQPSGASSAVSSPNLQRKARNFDLNCELEPANGEEKPNHSYAQLIAHAIQSSPSRMMTLNDIYIWITDKFPYYKTAPKGWRNSVRHNLSLNRAFVRVPRPTNEPGKGAYWTIDPSVSPKFKPARKAGRHERTTSEHASSSHNSPRLVDRSLTGYPTHTALPQAIFGPFSTGPIFPEAIPRNDSSSFTQMDFNKSWSLSSEMTGLGLFSTTANGSSTPRKNASSIPNSPNMSLLYPTDPGLSYVAPGTTSRPQSFTSAITSLSLGDKSAEAARKMNALRTGITIPEPQRHYVLKRTGSAGSSLRRQLSQKSMQRQKPVFQPILPKASDLANAAAAPTPPPATSSSANSANSYLPRSFSDISLFGMSNDQMLGMPSMQPFATQLTQNTSGFPLYNLNTGFPGSIFGGTQTTGVQDSFI